MSIFLPQVPQQPVDVIVPVYRGFALTRHCIESILASSGLIPFELIVVDDCSPEPELSAWLQEQAGQGRFTLLTNQDNLGFVGSVNRAMRQHNERDVVLLNSDTEVPSGWLDRLQRHAYSASSVGTVTPFSNNATLCSYPAYPHGSDLPAGWSVKELDGLFQQCNAGEQVAIPTAVGFCMYIRRDCLQAVGLFDEEAFGKGYGEENDFCMRASQKGWTHLLAGDCFVGHIGAVSFSDTRHQLQDSARRVILQRYPDYDQLIADFIARDPMHPLRKSVDIARLASGKRPVILTVSHQGGGGVEKHLRDFASHYAGELEILTLEPRDDGWATLFWNSEHERFSWGLQQHHAAGVLPWLVEHCGIQRLYIHHLLGYTDDFVHTLLDLGLPYDLMLHDYFYVCPQIHLQTADHRYCGEPDDAGCNHCLQQRPITQADNITTWRNRYAPLLQHAQNLFAPSFDTAARYLRHHPGLPIQILPHDDSQAHSACVTSPQPTPPDRLHIVVLGALGYGKGFETLRQAALQAQARQLPLRFTLLGYGDALLPEAPLTSLLVTGRYRDSALPAWLQRIQPDIVWFPAQIPETYSYTLSSTLNARLPVVVSNLGALPERVANRPWSWVMPWDTSVDGWLSFFTRIHQQHFISGQAPELPPAAALPDCKRLQRYPVPSLQPAQSSTKPVTAQQIKRQIYGYPLLDISIVTYNSADWLDGFFDSLLKGNYPLYQMRLLIRDNGSCDDTPRRLETWLQRLAGQLAGHHLHMGKNTGFGQGHNHNLQHARADYFLVTNVDLEFAPDTLTQLIEAAEQDPPTVACWEARQTPYEHPKHYDPVTQETSWCSSACALFRTSALQQVGGYEPRIFMYGEDVELSYRLRENGYRLRYVPLAHCRHHTHANPGAGPDKLQLAGALYASVALRMRYANRKEILAGWRQLLRLYQQPPAPLGRWQLTKIAARLLRDAHHYLSRHATSGADFPFNGLDYETARAGAFVPVDSAPDNAPLVSLVVVTSGFAADKIRNLLISINNQIWPCLEVIIIDDEQARARTLCNLYLTRIPTVHYYSGHWKNRAQAGNHGLQQAQGELIGLLNPDAMLYADHCNVLAAALLAQPDYSAAYSSYATPVQNEFAQGTALPGEIIYNGPFLRHRLWIWNFLCQHSVLFRRALFDRLGGFEESLSAWEDWHLWVKYSMNNRFYPLNKTTVIMQTPDSCLATRQGSSTAAEQLNQTLAKQQQPEDYQLMLKELSASKSVS